MRLDRIALLFSVVALMVSTGILYRAQHRFNDAVLRFQELTNARIEQLEQRCPR
jgi:hypothetical protein